MFRVSSEEGNREYTQKIRGGGGSSRSLGKQWLHLIINLYPTQLICPGNLVLFE